MTSGNDFFAIILMTVILAGIGVFVTQPLLRRRPESVLQNYYEETPFHELMAKKNSLYQTIKDLEFDFKTAKLSEEDYESLRAKLEREAIEVLEKIDKIDSKKDISSIASGSKRNSKKIKEASDVCPECNKPNVTEAKFCASCGGQLVKG